MKRNSRGNSSTISDLQESRDHKAMHILFIPSWYVSKSNPISGIFFKVQVEALRNRGHKVGVIVPPKITEIAPRRVILKIPGILMKPTQISFEKDNDVPVYRGVGWTLSRKYPINNYFFLRTSLKMFKKYIKEQGTPDIIHAHYARWAGIFALTVKKKYKVPYVLTEICTAYAEGKITQEEFPLIKEAFASADARIMVSPQLGALLEEKLGDSVLPWQWVPLIAAGYFFKTYHEPSLVARSNKFRFINIGMMHTGDQKGHRDLLTAFSKGFKNDDRVELVLVGDGPNKKNLIAYSHELNIADKVHFTGLIPNENIPGEISNSDAFLFSSEYETFGVAVAEALAIGKPVIATKSGGPECMINESNGILVEAKNIHQLAKAMVFLKENIDRYNPDLIKKDCFDRFSETVVIDQMLSIYNSIRRNRA